MTVPFTFSGDFEIQLITQLLTKHATIQTTVVEPAADHIERFQSLASTGGDLSEVAWDWRRQTLEEYREHRKDISDASKFHLILAIHCLYYVDDLEQSILDMMSCLEDGGLLVIMLVTGIVNIHCKYNIILFYHCICNIIIKKIIRITVLIPSVQL